MTSINDIFDAFEPMRLAMGLGKREFRQSYEGNKAAIEYKGREHGVRLLTTKEEFEQLPVPKHNGIQRFSWRKIRLHRKGKSAVVSIQEFLSGKTRCLTEEELRAVHNKQSEDAKLRQPHGVATNNNKEREATLTLNWLLKLHLYLICKEALEFRMADELFCKLGEEADGFVADQVKSAQVLSDGQFDFHLTVGRLRNEYLTLGLSVTCIGMVGKDVAVVYYFTPRCETLDDLSGFSSDQAIRPVLRLNRNSKNKFTAFLAKYRYEVGKDFPGSAAEIERLRLAKLEFCDTGAKCTYEYWNFDPSQVVCDTHKKELASYLRTRDAVTKVGGTCDKLSEDNYGPVDFRLFGARVQDKVVDSGQFTMCANGVPYSPDAFDVLTVSEVDSGDKIGMVPMRRRTDDGSVVCSFSPQELSKHTIRISNKFSAKVEWFERSSPEAMQRLVNRCAEYAAVPPVTQAASAE